MAKKKQKEEQGIEILENPEAISDKIGQVEDYINDKKNRNIVFGIGGLIVAVILGVIFFRYWSAEQNQEASAELTQAVFYFESDSLSKSLNGDGNNYGFLDIIDKYGSTDAGNLANYYAGATYLRLSSFENAIRYLKEFSTGDPILEAKAESMIGDAYMELEDYASAVSSYKSAVSASIENSELAPIYLMKLAIAQEENNNLEGAKESYATIVNKHKKSTFYTDARKHKARIEGLLAK
ncbi:MAG: tetratricopeptide repeat protein [Cyclobacteriaceae bacterium]